MACDPFRQFHRWFMQAQRAGVALPESAALATADVSGRPSVRFVLLKEADASGVVFYTNARSRKGSELQSNPHAALALYWDPIGKQVRMEGPIEEVSAAEADAYWATRPRASQLAAVASVQGAPLSSRRVLVARWRAVRRRYAGQAVPRPPDWTGFRLIPQAVEFWTRREPRLHHRELFTRTRRGWKRTLLQP